MKWYWYWYWLANKIVQQQIQHAVEEFKGAKYVNGGIDADRGVIYCVYVTAV